MRCEEFQPLIEEYLDSELNESAAGAVTRHLDDCGTCAQLARKLGVEREMYSRYAPDIEVTPALWAAIQARTAAEEFVPRPGRGSWLIGKLKEALLVPRVSGWATAALVLLAIGSTAVFMIYLQRETQSPPVQARVAVESQPPTQGTTQETSSPAAPGDSTRRPSPDSKRRVELMARTSQRAKGMRQETGPKTPHQLVHEAEQKYLAAIAMLSRNAARKRSEMDPVALEKLDQAIAAINRTIAGTRQAVRDHPDDPVAVQYMLTAYARKVDVLREMAAR